jgi:hypothetical protein
MSQIRARVFVLCCVGASACADLDWDVDVARSGLGTAASQRFCSESWSASMPANLGAYEFDKDLTDLGAANYGLNESFSWPLHMSSNVKGLNTHTNAWNTLTGDYLKIGTLKIQGNQGTAWSATQLAPTSASDIPLIWNSDGAGTAAGYPTVDLVRFKCLPPSQQTAVGPIRPISANRRYDAAFFVPNDVLYFSVTQPGGKPLFVTLDVNAATSDADFDLYASNLHERPSEGLAVWEDAARSSVSPQESGAAIYIAATPSSRTIYLGVVNHAGTGHVSLRANLVEDAMLTVCTQDIAATSLESEAPAWTRRMVETLRRTSMRVLQMTNGNLLFRRIRFKTQSTGLQSGWIESRKYCEGDRSCDLCMQAYGRQSNGQDGCGFSAQSTTGRMRIPNVRCQSGSRDPAYPEERTWANQEYFSRVLAHEAGHALKRMAHHEDVGTLLHDQYVGGFDPQDAHTIMNGPWGPLHTSYRLSTDFNHCKTGDPKTNPTNCSPKSDWTTIQESGEFPGWIYPNPNASSQPWLALYDNTRAWSSVVVQFQ